MTTRGTIGALTLAAAAGCAPVEPPRLPPPAASRPAQRAPAVPATELERAIHLRINQHRAGAGVAALAYDTRIADVAREHSRAMATRSRAFGHDGFQERSAAISRLIPLRRLAENVAYNSRTGPELVASLVTGWPNSAGHRKNIDGAFDLTGIGVARTADGVSYVTQIFVSR